MLRGKRKTESESALFSIPMLSCETSRKSESTPLVELAHENHKLKQKLSTAESQLQERRDSLREISSIKNFFQRNYDRSLNKIELLIKQFKVNEKKIKVLCNTVSSKQTKR